MATREFGSDNIPLLWEPGDTILDMYEVREMSSGVPYLEGGMGRINRVWHKQWNKDLAVKSVNKDKLTTPGAVGKFLAEAEDWVDKIGLHPHVVGCHYVRILGGLPRVFVEYVDGGSLKHWIRSRHLYEGGHAVALERILDIAIQLAWGLHYVHELGLIHQDVKPDNVMMTADGVAKVTDFGLANARAVALDEDGERPTSLTLLATYGGSTPAYCSCEQADIDAKRRAGVPRDQCAKLTRRTDLWSWAVSVLEMFKGVLPWEHIPKGSGSGAGHFLTAPTAHDDVPAMPAAVQELLQHCFQRLEEDRPHDMMTVADKLLDIYRLELGRSHSREVPKAANLLADTVNNRAVSLIDLGKHQDAQKRLDEAIQADSLHSLATYNSGLLQWRNARINDDALLARVRALALARSGESMSPCLLASVHLERGDCESALRTLQEFGESGDQELDAIRIRAQQLQPESRRCLRILEGHKGAVNSVAFTPDGQFALSASADKTVIVWEVATGRCLRTFEGHTGEVTSVELTANGRRALSGSLDKTLKLWDVSTGQCLRTFEGHTQAIKSVSLAGDRLALSCSQTEFILWELSPGRCLRTFERTALGDAVCLRSDGRLALTEGLANSVHALLLWDTNTGTCLRTLEGHRSLVSSLQFSADGRLALSGSSDNTAKLWDVSEERCLRTFTGHAGGVSSVSLSADGRHVLSGSWDGTVKLWKASTGRCLHTFEGHKARVTSVSLTADGLLALSGNKDGTVKLWEIAPNWSSPAAYRLSRPPATEATTDAQNEFERTLAAGREAIARSEWHEAARLLARARDLPGYQLDPRAVRMWAALYRHLPRTRLRTCWEGDTFKGTTQMISGVSVSADGRLALSVENLGTVKLWEVAEGRRLIQFQHKYADAVWLSGDGKFALSGGTFGELKMWDATTGRCLRSFEKHGGRILSVVLNTDARFALSGSNDGTLKLWEVSTGRCLRTFEGHTTGVHAVALSADGSGVLSGGEDAMVKWWDLSTGRCRHTFQGHNKRVASVALTIDARFALSGSADKTLKLWELSSGRCLRTFEGHASEITSVDLTADAKLAASGSSDSTVKLWELDSGRCLHSFDAHNSVTSVCLSEDGWFVLAGMNRPSTGLWSQHTDDFNQRTRREARHEDRTLRHWFLDWELDIREPADWDEGARPYLAAFLAQQVPFAAAIPQDRSPTEEEITLALTHRGMPTWTEDDFGRLLDRLGCAGYGWLRPDGVRRELQKMAATWQGPPPLV